MDQREDEADDHWTENGDTHRVDLAPPPQAVRGLVERLERLRDGRHWGGVSIAPEHRDAVTEAIARLQALSTGGVVVPVETVRKWKAAAENRFMTSSLSEYCPAEFIELADAYLALAAPSAPLVGGFGSGSFSQEAKIPTASGEPLSGQLWAVTGTVGEYSDRSEWTAAVFESEDDAKAFAERMDALGRQWWSDWSSERYQDNPEMEAAEDAMKALEAGWSHDYSGPAAYTAGSVPFIRAGGQQTGGDAEGVNPKTLSPSHPVIRAGDE